jgi:DNA-binding winged helix-turn-helix (wHTH) protein/tetratricopeptide (TPR) repeat protein
VTNGDELSTDAALRAEVRAYRVGGFEVDLRSLELRNAKGQRLELTPLAFKLFVYLIEHRDRVVSREELFEALWGDVVVTDGALSQVIWTVRRALGDTGGAQRIIKNFRTRGYRLSAEVEVVSAAQPERAAPVRFEPVARSASADLVGRGEELRELEWALEQVLAGNGRIHVLTGWPGVGKTRLAQEVCTRAQVRGARVCEARCFDAEGSPPLWPWQQIARELIGRQPPERLSALVGDGAVELVKLIPELHEGVPGLSQTPQHELGHARVRMFDALCAMLQTASREQPLVLLIDDLQWADESTLGVLEFLAPQWERMPILLLCTMRAGAHGKALSAVVANVMRHSYASLMELSGLDEAGVATLLENNALRDVDPRLVGRVLDVTGGNPFFVLQLARWLERRDTDAIVRGDQPLALPAQARAVLSQHLALLPESCRELLDLCAVLGQVFHLGDLRRAADLPATTVLSRLVPALDGGVLHAEGAHAGAFAFAHSTIRETLYQEMPHDVRVQRHLQVAEAIAKAHGDEPAPRLTELAHHYHQAAAGGGAAQASRYCRLAAQRAYEATAFEDAVVWYERALSALAMRDAVDDAERCELLLQLGQAMRGARAGHDEIRAVFAQAAAIARRIGRVELLCEAAMCHAGRGAMRVAALREPGTIESAEIELLQQVKGMLEPGDSEGRALVEAWLAYSLYNSERREHRRELAHGAVAMARRVGSAGVIAECLMLLQHSVRGPAELDGRIDALTEIIELASSEALGGLRLDAHCERAWAYWERGAADAAEADMHAVQRLAEEFRQPRDKLTAARWRAMRLDAEGRFDAAEALYDEITRQSPLPQGRTDQHRAIRDMNVLHLKNRAPDTIPALEAYAQKFPLPVAWHCGLTSMYASAGRYDDAERELERLSVERFSAIPDDHNWITSHTRLAWAVWTLRHRAHAAVLYDKLAPYADRLIVIGLYGFCGGFVHKPLGELAAVLGDYERADAHFARATEEATRLRAFLWVAASQLSRAEMLIRRGRAVDRPRANDDLDAVLRFAKTHGVTRMLVQAETLRRTGGLAAPIRGRA